MKYAKLCQFEHSPMKQFQNLAIDRNPFMSPYLASSEMLQTLPPISLIVSYLHIEFSMGILGCNLRDEQRVFLCNHGTC